MAVKAKAGQNDEAPKSNTEQLKEQGIDFDKLPKTGASRLDQTMGDQGKPGPEEGFDLIDNEPQNQGAAVWSDTVDLDASKLQIPFISILQGLSKPVLEDKAKMGDIWVTGYEPMKEVILVPLKFGVSRNYSERNEKNELVSVCYSPTGQEHGIALSPEGPGIACNECPLKDWQPTDRIVNGRKVNDPPPCKESYDFLVWSESHQTLARIGFRSTGLKAGRLMATLGKTKGLAKFAVVLTSARKSSNGYTYAIPEITVLGGEQGAEYVEMGQAVLALNG